MAQGVTLGSAFVQIVPSAEGIQGSVTRLLGGEAKSAGTATGSSIAAFAKKAFFAVGGATAIVDAFKMGAQIEQSLGGVETLYKDSADTVIKYADQAYKTAGISANSYMEQSTSFAAALLNSLGGDTKKAAEASNTAIMDMADNSNKMGTALESIQMAYQGFAKQNYTMLDNLKLGYGGTKTEMERLLTDAEKISGVHYDINNLSDVYSAIHVIQGELDITGTTALEAEHTLSGSFMSMKAAVQDFMGNLIMGRNVTQSMTNIGTTVSTFLFNNLLPAIGRVILNLPTAAVTFISTAIPTFLNNITSLLDKFSKGKFDKQGNKMISRFVRGMIKALPLVGKAVVKLIAALMRAIAKLPGKLFKAGIKAIRNFIRGLKNLKLPKMKVTWSTDQKKGDGGWIKIPKPHITWAAKGGIVDGATLVGAGEAGAEAIVPLDPFWNKLDAKLDGNGSGGVLSLTINLDGDTIGRKTIEYINGQTLQFGTSTF